MNDIPKLLPQLDSTPMGLVPKTFDELWKISKILASSSMIPRGLNKAEDIFVATQMGLELNLYPIQAIQNIAVINGRPALWGDAVIGLVLRSGLLESFEEYFEGDFPNDNFMAICKAKRKGLNNIFRKEFSIADAKKARLWPSSHDDYRNQSPWAKYPKRMLQMRARSWTLRDSFADILKGFYPVEEAIDIPPVEEKQRTDPSIITKAFEANGNSVSEDEIMPQIELTTEIIDSTKENNNIKDEQKEQIISEPPRRGRPSKSKKITESKSEPFDSINSLLSQLDERINEKYFSYETPPEFLENLLFTQTNAKEYLNIIHTTTNKPTKEVITAALANFEGFWTALISWIQNRSKTQNNIT